MNSNVSIFLIVLMGMLACCSSKNRVDAQETLTAQSLAQLNTELMALQREYQAAGEVAIKLPLLQKVLSIREAITVGLQNGDSAFLAGSQLEQATGEQIAQVVETMKRAMLDHEYLVAGHQRELGQYQESLKTFQDLLPLLKSSHGEKSLQALNCQLESNKSQWLSEADATAIATLESLKESSKSALAKFQQQDIESAVSLLEEVVTGFEKLNLTNSRDYGEAVANLAEGLMQTGRLKEAEPAFERAIEVNDRLFQSSGVVNANMRRSYSEVFNRSKRHARAVEILEEADQFYVAVGSEKSADRAVAMIHRGNNLKQLGRYAEATQTFYQAVHLLVELNDNRFFGMLQQAVYDTYVKMNDVTTPPAAVAEKAAEIANSIFGDDTQESANWLITIAKTKRSLNENENVVAIYERAGKLLETLEDPAQSGTYLACIDDLAALHNQNGDLDRALAYAIKAVGVFKQKNGADAPMQAVFSMKVGFLQSAKGSFGDAEAIFSSVDERLVRTLGDQHSAYHGFLTKRAENFDKMQKWDSAIQIWSRLQSLQTSAPEMPVAARQRTLEGLANSYEQAGNVDMAATVKAELVKLKQ